MGSEQHYCLRWNNHQSNLLGVFSQLLQDESLVDVTLACSEGASIRAHKVVLSACSSYFQSLFLDHPSRHPIVILKDVRFAELRTLIDFMYKGEVNVEYCQLSALLKTAESLKVKGLAEMTNQSSALRESEREQDHLRPPLNLTPKSESLDTTSTATNSNSKRLKPERCSPSPTRRDHHHLHHHQQQQHQQQKHQQQQDQHHQQEQSTSKRKTPDEYYENKTARHHRSTDSYDKGHGDTTPSHSHHSIHHLSQSAVSHHIRQQTPSPPTSLYSRKMNRDRDFTADIASNDEPIQLQAQHPRHHHQPIHHHKKPKYSLSIEERHPRERLRSDDEDLDEMDDEDDAMSNDHETGINMTINSNSINSIPPILKSSSSPTVPSTANSSISDSHPQSSSSHRNQSANNNSTSIAQVGNNSYNSATTTSTCTSTSSGLPAASGITSPNISSDSGHPNEPIAGPSGLGPVQSVPLSLKKEMDWERSDDKSVGESSSDYRHAHDSDASVGHESHQVLSCIYCGASFPHQSKLTRHILSHSLDSLKYRDSLALQLSSFPHEPHFTQRSSALLDSLDPSGEGGLENFDFAAAAAAAAAAMQAASGGGGGSNSTAGSGASNNDQGSVVLCKFCGKSFPDVTSLIAHLPVHTGDRPFKCEFCGKAFKLRHHMKDHCRVHTGERPFRCGMCGKTFSRSTILKAHEKTHFPKYVRKFLSPSPVDGKEEPPQ